MIKHTMKVYQVYLGELIKEGKNKGDWENVSKKNVLAENAKDAIASAMGFLSKKQQKTYYVIAVEQICTLD